MSFDFLDSTDIYLQFLDLGAFLDADELVIRRSDDDAAGPISIDTDFPFGDSNQANFYVSTTNVTLFISVK